MTDSPELPSPPESAGYREVQRLRWKCRRGMLELDLILGRFLECGYARLDASQRASFSRLLETPDVDLQEWIAGKAEPPDSKLLEILRKVL